MAPVAVNQVIENDAADAQAHDRQRRSRSGPSSIRRRTARLCDENQLENAILNLAINARDAMPDGGTLTISTEPGRARRTGSTSTAGDYVCIAVADTGQGMAPEVAARATEPFFSTKPLGKGTGLGLAQVYGIARQSGGTLRIESREGEGTIVRLLLPRGRAPRADEAPRRAAEPARAGLAPAPAPRGSWWSTTTRTCASSSPTLSIEPRPSGRDAATAPRRRWRRWPRARRTSCWSISPCPG